MRRRAAGTRMAKASLAGALTATVIGCSASAASSSSALSANIGLEGGNGQTGVVGTPLPSPVDGWRPGRFGLSGFRTVGVLHRHWRRADFQLFLSDPRRDDRFHRPGTDCHHPRHGSRDGLRDRHAGEFSLPRGGDLYRVGNGRQRSGAHGTIWQRSGGAARESPCRCRWSPQSAIDSGTAWPEPW